MKLSQFKFDLPQEQIAQYPAPHRDECRMMVLHRKTGEIEHRMFKDILDFFDEHDSVVIYTPTRRLTYRIFAAYKRDDVHLMKKFDYTTNDGRLAFFDDIFSHKGNFRTDVPLATDSRIITLSTCVGGENDKRYVVQAVLIEDAPVE